MSYWGGAGGWGPRAGGRGGPRAGPAGVREAEPEPRLPARGSRARGRLPSPIPLPGARFRRPEPLSGLLGAAGAGKHRAGLRGAGDPQGSLDPRGSVVLLSRRRIRAAESRGRPE